MELQGEYINAGAGAVIESNYFSVNIILIGNNNKNVNINTGFAVHNGRMRFTYNYRLNVMSGSSLLPLSLLHEAGLAFSLNNVDKRKIIKTINFPKL
jgi:hypothetical protein